MDDALGRELLEASNRGGGGRFAADTGAIDDGFGAQNLLIADLGDDSCCRLNDRFRALEADGIADIDGGGQGMRLDGLESDETIAVTRVKRVRTCRLDGGDARKTIYDPQTIRA